MKNSIKKPLNNLETVTEITQMCITAIANLQQASFKEGTNKTMFSKEKVIIPYIEYHWEALTTTSRRVTQSWHVTVTKALIKDIHIYFVFDDNPVEGHMYGLMNQDLTQIKPNYEAMIRGGTLKVTDMGIQHEMQKRKFPGDVGNQGKKGRGVDLGAPKLPAHGYPLDHPFNKDGYRYLLAEPDPHAPFRQEFDESSDWAGKPIPGWLYRTSIPGTVLLALHDRAPQLKNIRGPFSCHWRERIFNCQGNSFDYKISFVFLAVTRGIWYWEVTIEEMPEGSATRIGWGQDYANLQAPLGYDKFGYSWRSKKGTRFHESAGKRYSPGYGEGDTLGFMIILPQNSATKLVPNTYKDRLNSKATYTTKIKTMSKKDLNNSDLLWGVKLFASKNGESQGIAFQNIYQGTYYPTMSVHKNVTVSVNFGPTFKCPPSIENYNYRPMSERGEEAICDQTMADIIYLTENEGKLRLDSFVL
ncbi:hypothetical protein NQ317_013759 [Molorchus minor]|uniref:B30.2/SPRY domain-containing protein n=1 Tax=Molorchus minor TaxID=1323400 RepID=A0ABQ9JT60_9CUCU|nr:hypothetical protein NQ317_013759 [Molorchus minor]